MDTSVVGPAATEKWTRRSLIAGLCLGLLVVQANKADAQQSAAYGEWRSYASDKANTKYTPLEQIDRDNVSKLRVLWRRPGVDPELTETFPDLSPSNDLRATPLMLGGVLYTSNSVGLVEALDPGTGETLWIQEPIHEGFQGVAGRSTRGVAHWSSGSNQRVFSVQGDYLVSMSAETGSLGSRLWRRREGGSDEGRRHYCLLSRWRDVRAHRGGRRGYRRRRGRRRFSCAEGRSFGGYPGL